MTHHRACLALLSVLACIAAAPSISAQEAGEAAFGFSLGAAFGVTSVEDFGVSDGGLGFLGRVRWKRFDLELAVHHLGSNPTRTNVDPEGTFRTEILLGSRHMLASYRIRLGRLLLRPGLGVAWYSIEFGPDRRLIQRVSQADAAIALSVGIPVIRRPGWELGMELAGRAKLPIGEDSSSPRNVLALQLVVSR